MPRRGPRQWRLRDASRPGFAGRLSMRVLNLGAALLAFLLQNVGEAQHQERAGQGEGVMAETGLRESELRLERGVARNHLAGHPAEEGSAAPHDDRPSL